MNWIRENLRTLTILLALLAVASIWRMHSNNQQLQGQLDSAIRNVAQLDVLLQTANTTVDTQRGQIDAIVTLGQQYATDIEQLLKKVGRINQQATTRAVQLETLTHENPDAKNWGDTRLPADVQRLLDFHTTAASDPASTPIDHQQLPAGDSMPAAAGQPGNQPPVGTKHDPTPAGA